MILFHCFVSLCGGALNAVPARTIPDLHLGHIWAVPQLGRLETNRHL